MFRFLSQSFVRGQITQRDTLRSQIRLSLLFPIFPLVLEGSTRPAVAVAWGAPRNRQTACVPPAAMSAADRCPSKWATPREREWLLHLIAPNSFKNNMADLWSYRSCCGSSPPNYSNKTHFCWYASPRSGSPVGLFLSYKSVHVLSKYHLLLGLSELTLESETAAATSRGGASPWCLLEEWTHHKPGTRLWDRQEQTCSRPEESPLSCST